MNIETLRETYQQWQLFRYVDGDRLAELTTGTSGQIHAERIYAYHRSFNRGHIIINAWYYPMSDPYGEYPYEIQFFFAIRSGEILKEVSIFEPDIDAQFRTVTEAMDDIEKFFWKRLSMKLTDVIPLLGAPAIPDAALAEAEAEPESAQEGAPVVASDEAVRLDEVAALSMPREEVPSGRKRRGSESKGSRIRKVLRSSFDK